MTVYLSPVAGAAAQFLDNSGNVLTGGKLYTYAAGTTTPQVTYTSSAGITFLPNPIILDAAGRVPTGEIWLADSLVYKFVLKDSNDVLIATWDNLVGINSNFVNFTVQEEIQTATAGQTVFNLSTISYTPGSNSLQVFVDGVNQYDGAMYAYIETNSTTVTFTSGLHVGASVKFTNAVSNSSGIQTNASLVTYDPPFTGGVATTVETKLSEFISVKDFGAVGDGVADDSLAIQTAQTAATAANATLYFPYGTYLCKDITLGDITVQGVIKSTAATLAETVVLNGAIDAPFDRQIFDWTAAAPTNLPGTTVPFAFADGTNFRSPVSVKWFGAKGDNTTDDTETINACATAMSFSITGGTPYAPLQGPIEMFFPRGNYVIAGTLKISNGTLMRGEKSGSNPLSTLIRDESALGVASADDMIWMVKDNQTYTENPTQAFFEDLSFVWLPTSDFSTSTLQFQTAFISFKAAAISVKMQGCWFLGSPQKGSLFSWGNNYVISGTGTGITKVNTGADSDGINVDISIFDTWSDVTYGTYVNVFDKGYGFVQLYNAYIYQLWMGFASNYSTNSTNRLLFSIDGGTLYGVNIQLAPTYPVPSTGVNSTTVWKELRNMDIFLNNLQIYSRNMSSQNFCFTNYLVNSNMRMTACYVDSAVDALYSTQMWKLDWKVNSLTLIGNEFFGPMTPNPATITAPWPKAMISKLTGSVTDDGITSILYLDSNKIDVGTMDYFIKKETAFSQISNFYCCNNYINIPSTKFSFDTTGVLRYLMARNAWQATPNNLEVIP